jgi:hypothetical protein
MSIAPRMALGNQHQNQGFANILNDRSGALSPSG